MITPSSTPPKTQKNKEIIANDRFNNIIKNNEYNIELDYDKIYYYSVIDKIVLNGDKNVTKSQYTTDITKAKNFAKYKNDYIEINKEDN